MKQWLTNLPIRKKLMVLACLASGIALLVAGFVHALSDYKTGHLQLTTRLQIQAKSTASNSAAALAFADEEAAGRTLEALRADPAITKAQIDHADGTVFVTRALATGVAGKEMPTSSWPPIHVTSDIALGEHLGVVRIWASTAEVEQELRHDLVVMLIIVLGAMVIALAAASWLQRIVSQPIVALASAARRVSESRDYSLRVPVHSTDEVGELITSFNDMLGQIEARDAQLREYHAQLESKVEARTAELGAALKDAQAAARAKAQFLANMSHEIRTPMNGVIGMLDLLDTEPLDAQQRGTLDTARNSADALLTIIDDVLDFSKIDAGKLELEETEVELRQIVEEVATLFSRQAHTKGVELSCMVHQDVPAVVRSDPTRLRQILSNLVSNAVKFTEGGEVHLGLRVVATHPGEGSSAGTALVQMEVRDTGIGMENEVIQRLFQAFTQADTSTTRRYGGTGLGLTIARRLAEAMQGTIEVDSSVGKGSTFRVTMPLPIVSQSAATTKPVDLTGLKVLIVDDNATNRRILEHYLTSAGMQFESADSARAGLKAARKAAAAAQPFDIVVLDYQMPEMDGLGFIAELRADPPIARTPCVVLSSLGDRSGVANASTVAAWLAKPVRQASLIRILATVSGRTAGRDQLLRTAAPDTSFTGARVLLVEDNVVNQQVARRLLSAFGISAELAVNGEEAFTYVRTEHFDAVLMDCQMPVMDGYAATRAIREWERSSSTTRIPIIAMTANAMPGDRERCIAAGMDDYIAKPIKREILSSTLSKWLAPITDEESARVVKALTETPVATGTEQPQLDEHALEQLREVMQEDFGDIVETYLSDTPSQLAAMSIALSRGDNAMLSRGAHSLKSSSQSMGAHQVAEAAARLESAARAGDTAQTLNDRLTELTSIAERTLPLLRSAILRTGASSPNAATR